MNIILGFGSTEENFEKQERDFVDSFFQEKSSKDFVFSDEIVDELRNALKERTEVYKSLSDTYKIAPDHPERYGYYYFSVINDPVDLCVVCSFTHINRKHPMSPDGWGAMYTEPVWHFKYRNYQLDN